MQQPQELVQEIIEQYGQNLSSIDKKEAEEELLSSLPEIRQTAKQQKHLSKEQISEYCKKELVRLFQNNFTSVSTESLNISQLILEKKQTTPSKSKKSKRKLNESPSSPSPSQQNEIKNNSELVDSLMNLIVNHAQQKNSTNELCDEWLSKTIQSLEQINQDDNKTPKCKPRYRSPSPEPHQPSNTTTTTTTTSRRSHSKFQSNKTVPFALPFFNEPIRLEPVKIKGSNKAAFWAKELKQIGTYESDDGEIYEIECNCSFIIKGSERWPLH